MQVVTDSKRIGVVGRLGVFPMEKLSLPARRLLAFLAIRSGQTSRQRCVDELWPDLSEDLGRANLRRALWQVPQSWINVVGDELVLLAECDLPCARQAVSRAISGQLLELDEIDLLASDILPGWHEEWVIGVQAEFHIMRVQALECACRSLAHDDQHALAIRAGTAAVAAEPLRESAAEALIDAHLGQGNRFAALQCFGALAKQLREELGIEPDTALSEKMDLLVGTRRVA